MSKNNTSTHITIIKYVLVGVLLIISILALGWGVWSYTYQQHVADMPPIEHEPPTNRLSDDAWSEQMNAPYQGTTTPQSDEEWSADVNAEYQGTTTPISEDDWNARLRS